MKKILILLITLFMISCSNEPITTDIITADAKANLQKGKPTTTTCTDLVIPIGVDKQKIINKFNGILIGYETPVIVDYAYATTKNETGILVEGKSIIIGNLIHRVPNETNTGYLPYEEVNYNFSVYNSDGELVEQGCVFPGNNVAYWKFGKPKGKIGIYTLKFDDFPEVTKEYGFEIK